MHKSNKNRVRMKKLKKKLKGIEEAFFIVKNYNIEKLF